MAMTVKERTRHRRAERVAARRGFRLQRCGRRNPDAPGFGGWVVYDRQNQPALGVSGLKSFTASIEDVERYLEIQPPKAGQQESGR